MSSEYWSKRSCCDSCVPLSYVSSKVSSANNWRFYWCFYVQKDYNHQVDCSITCFPPLFLFGFLTWIIGSSISQLHSYLITIWQILFGGIVAFVLCPMAPIHMVGGKDITFVKRQKSMNSFCFILSWHALKFVGKNPSPLNVYEWIKIYNYLAIAILWKQKISKAPHKHNHTRIPNLTWKTLRYRAKNHQAAPKIFIMK